MVAYLSTSRRDIHVDRINGSTTGNGSQGNPTNTLALAMEMAGANGGGRILCDAPEASPLPRAVLFPTCDVTVEPWHSFPFYMAGVSSATLWHQGTGLLTVHGVHCLDTLGADYGARVGQSGGIDTGCPLVCYDCYFAGTISGFQTAFTWSTVDLYRCQGQGSDTISPDGNDGFNVHGDPGVLGVFTATDCVADDCYDEGFSPHDDTTMHLIRPTARRNGQSGMAAVNNAVCTIDGGVIEGNGVFQQGYGGVYYSDAASGSIDGGAQIINNLYGPGIWLDRTTGTLGTITLGSYTSSGNGLPDSL